MTANEKGKSHAVELTCCEDELVQLKGYKFHKVKNLLTWAAILLTLGFLRLIFHWKPQWMIWCTYVPCSLKEADAVIISDHYKQLFVAKIIIDDNSNDSNSDWEKPKKSTLLVPKNDGNFQTVCSVRYFQFKKHKYVWYDDNIHGYFKQISSLGDQLTCGYIHSQKGLTELQQNQRRHLFGSNIIQVPVYSTLKLLFLEVLHPIYIFQVFSISLWYSDEYEQYASVILAMSIISISVGVYQLRKNQRSLYNTVRQSGVISICRHNNQCVDGSSDEVVPGDVIVIPSGGLDMMCDAVLVSGSCIVNESSLTGESVPVTKTALPNYADTQFDPSQHCRHILYCGTRIIQTRYYGTEKVKAVVIKTGFMTQKGNLVRSIMFPKPVDFKFSQDISKFIAFLATIAACGFIYTVIIMERHGEDIATIIKRGLDLITIVIPPALPAAMTVGIIYAQSRLKRGHIFCISPRSINISGSVNCVCFDKTGTLTEEGLDVLGVMPSCQTMFKPMETAISKLPVSDLTICLATCHSLTIIDNEICGDPLDVKMFEAVDWELIEPDVADENKFEMITPTVVKPKLQQHQDVEIGIIRQLTFSSSLQRMSVIIRSLTAKHFELYTKGSPEMIASLCIPSTVPSDFGETLKKYTMKGFRVIGLAHRVLAKLTYMKAQKIQRSDIECELNFIGLLVMENRLKEQTKDTIVKLHNAHIRTVMITGDNILTAMSVARECHMLKPDETCLEIIASRQPTIKFASHSPDHSSNDDVSITKESLYMTLGKDTPGGGHMRFVIGGKSLEVVQQFYPQMIGRLMHQGVIFARMSPDQKQFIIENLQEQDYKVCMCGDGANDCGALKAAHAGISLSEAEASIASPFTSKKQDISCVLCLMREGRAALVTSFGMFKYMALYSICQFTSVILLYTFKSNLTDWEYMYIDLFLITSFAALFGRTEAYEKLSRRPPSLSLISATPILSVIVHVVFIAAFQFIAYYITTVQPWYEVHNPDVQSEEDNFASYDNFSIFSVSLFQYIGTAIIFSKGAPYRKSILTNRLFVLAAVLLTGMSVYLVLYPAQAIIHAFEFRIAPSISFRAMLLLVAFVHFKVSFLFEFFIIDYVLSKRIRIDERSLFKNVKSKYNDLSDNSPTESSSPPTILSPLSLDSPINVDTPSSPAHDNSVTEFTCL